MFMSPVRSSSSKLKACDSTWQKVPVTLSWFIIAASKILNVPTHDPIILVSPSLET